VFLSYRVASDTNIALLIYEKLSRRGIRVWFDKMNILPGREWEQEFADGLLTSSCFVCLLSRNAINHPNKPIQNFNALESSSKADSVLIEWNLALEFAERGLLTKIYPIMIGDKVIAETEGEPMVTYTNYFSSGCHPSSCKDVIVESVELRMKAHLERQVLHENVCAVQWHCLLILMEAGVMVYFLHMFISLTLSLCFSVFLSLTLSVPYCTCSQGMGHPYRDPASVQKTVADIVSRQGSFIEGDLDLSVKKLVGDICSMIERTGLSNPSSACPTSRRGSPTTTQRKRLEEEYDKHNGHQDFIPKMLNHGDSTDSSLSCIDVETDFESDRENTLEPLPLPCRGDL
jgi:TIR domain